jgi:8-oxo-dGTP pyrophosphatase MutT (NUDIX family)
MSPAWPSSTWRVLEAGDPGLHDDRDPMLARRQLEALVVISPEQASTRDAIVAAARTHPDILERTCRPGHLTGSALVVDADAARVLVLLHAKLGRWLQPGGHADGEANLAAVALREATEETGIAGLRVVVPAIDVDVHEVEPPAEDAHLHLDCRFLVLAPTGARARGNHESRALRWVSPEDLDALGADEGLRRLARTGLAVAQELRRCRPG